MSKGKSKSKRVLIGLVNEETGERDYYTKKNKQNEELKGAGKLRLKKYSPTLRRSAWYTETTKNLGKNEVK